MDKREFLKTSGVILTGSLVQRYVSAEPQAEHRTNWAGNYEYHAKNLISPKTTEEVQAAVKNCSTLKALGARHSFNNIADNPLNQISLKQLDTMVLDEKARTVTVGAGVTYGQLAPYIDAKGYALHNLASLPHISVVGACATATHGSGNKNGNLSTAVVAMEIVTADGEVKTLSRKDGDRFHGAVVGLGGLGVITKMTVDVQPTYQVAQAVYENLSMAQLEKQSRRDFRQRLQREPLHRLAKPSHHPGVDQAKDRTGHHAKMAAPNSMARRWRRRSFTRFQDTPPRAAPIRGACRVRGTSGCRTSR